MLASPVEVRHILTEDQDLRQFVRVTDGMARLELPAVRGDRVPPRVASRCRQSRRPGQAARLFVGAGVTSLSKAA